MSETEYSSSSDSDSSSSSTTTTTNTTIEYNINYIEINENKEIKEEIDKAYNIGIKLFKNSNKSIKCTLFLNDINYENLKNNNSKRNNYLKNELTLNDKKRKRSKFINNQIEKNSNNNNKQILESIKNEKLEQLKQSIITYDEIISSIPKSIHNKKNQIIYTSDNTEYIDKPCTLIEPTQYNYLNLNLSKSIFDQIYEYEIGGSTTTTTEEPKEEEEEVQQKEEEEEEEVQKEEEEEQEEDKVFLFPYWPTANVYNIIDDVEGDDSSSNFKPISNFNHRYKYHSTNVTLYNIYKNSREPMPISLNSKKTTDNSTTTTTTDIQQESTTTITTPTISKKKEKKKKFFKRG